MKMKVRVDKYIKEDCEKVYHCDLKPENIIKQTTYFDKKQRGQFVGKKLKYAILGIILLIAFFIIGFVKYEKVWSLGSNYTDQTIEKEITLNETEMAYLEQQKISCSLIPYKTIIIKNNVIIYIIKGRRLNQNNEIENVYCYKIESAYSIPDAITMKLDNQPVDIRENQTFGTLFFYLSSEHEKYQNVNLEVTMGIFEKNYVIDFSNQNK